jgi:hypothetical protein
MTLNLPTPRNPQQDIWTALAAAVPAHAIQWRQNGRPTTRAGKFFAPFVAYIDAQLVRERLDDVVPGEWDLHLELLPTAVAADGEASDEPCAFKARLQVLGVIREDVGMGRDYKNAATDAFKRAAMRFGIGHELYTDYEIVWVQVDGDGKYAKALEDPAEVYARRQQRSGSASGHGEMSGSNPTRAASTGTPEARSSNGRTPQPTEPTEPLAYETATCPKCSGLMWDNRASKKNPKAPDFKCRDKSCDGVIWPPKNGAAPAKRGVGGAITDADYPGDDEAPY